MFITINPEYTGTINEDDLLNENPDEVGIFATICQVIDELKIAKFSVLFKEWDTRFNLPDFNYDFSDIATGLPGLIQFLENKSGEYLLQFHELDRTIKFTTQEEILFFSICGNSEDVLHNGKLDRLEFKTIIENLIHDFKTVLLKYFPKSCEVLIKEKYIISY